MSVNINQIFVANPITSNLSTDLMYFGQSPYGLGNDAAMTFANFAAQFVQSNVLTTKGDLLSFSTVNARLPVGTTNGQILQVASAAATGLAYSTPTYPSASGAATKILISDGTNNIYSTSLWVNSVGSAGTIIRSNGTTNIYSTSTFADTYAVSTILYAGSTNAVSGLATVNSASLSTNATGVPTWLGLTDGQVVIGSSAGAPLAATISAGTGINVANGHNSITISASSGSGINSWIAAASTPITAAINTGYYITDASQVTITLPVTAAAGSVVAIVGNGAGGWILAPGAGQTIKVIGSSASTSITSAEQYDCIEVLCVVANTTWVARSLLSTGLTIV